MCAESPIADSLPLGDLLEEKELKIADSVPISNAYIESQYIGRTLRHHIAIKQDMFRDTSVKDKHVFLASAEKEFNNSVKSIPIAMCIG